MPRFHPDEPVGPVDWANPTRAPVFSWAEPALVASELAWALLHLDNQHDTSTTEVVQAFLTRDPPWPFFSVLALQAKLRRSPWFRFADWLAPDLAVARFAPPSPVATDPDEAGLALLLEHQPHATPAGWRVRGYGDAQGSVAFGDTTQFASAKITTVRKGHL